MEALLSALVRRGGRVLDAGCGSGETSRYIAERGCSVLAVDSALSADLDGRREACGAGTIDWRKNDFRLEVGGMLFDSVGLLNVLHTAGEETAAADLLGCAARATAAGGRLAVSWIADDIPPDQPCYLPSRKFVSTHLLSLGFEAVVWREIEVEHRHSSWLDGALHRHLIVYSTWRAPAESGECGCRCRTPG